MTKEAKLVVYEYVEETKSPRDGFGERFKASLRLDGPPYARMRACCVERRERELPVFNAQAWRSEDFRDMEREKVRERVFARLREIIEGGKIEKRDAVAQGRV